mgnify:FL=1
MKGNDLIELARKKEKERKYDEAINLFKEAFEQDPKNFFLQIELGNIFAVCNKFEEAAGCFRRANRRFPDNEDIKVGLGFCLSQIGNKYHAHRNFSMAQAAFEEATFFCPKDASYFYNLGNAYYAQGNFQMALKSFEQSSSLVSDSDTYHNIGNTFKKINDFTNAKINYKLALDLKENQIHTVLELIQLKQNICDWNDISELIMKLKNHLTNHNSSQISPFAALSMPGLNNKEHLAIANSWINSHNLDLQNNKKISKKNFDEKIIIAYMSADFRMHPLYYLIIDILKLHNREKFEIKLLYSGKNDNSAEMKEFKSLDADFITINELPDKMLCDKIIEEKVDILIDLSGFTMSSRSMIASYKPAPITINWLGFPGTMGYFDKKPLYDFLLSDDYIIPENQETYYAEQIIRLPNCYQPNIGNRPQSKAVEKSYYGIDEQTFVFASFGQSVKISEDMFKVWLNLLKNKNNSILWLLESNVHAHENLKTYAREYGIDSERIIFAAKVEFQEHISRHTIIDLFLDTYPYNAHTSASDALWAGCPILTMSGDTFASRVAGSILKEIGCDDLVTDDIEEYFNKALYLANNEKELMELKNRIAKGRTNSTLFKPKTFVKNLEDIYSSLLTT